MKKKTKFIFLIAFLTMSIMSFGQQSMSLQECINMAWERNLDLRAQSYNFQSTEIDIKQAKQARLPNLNANTRLGLNLGKTIDPTSNDFINTSFLSNNFSLSSNVTIYNYNKINNLIKQSKLAQLSSAQDYEQLKLSVALQVTNAYVNTLFALENFNNVKLQLENSQSQLERIDVFIQAGSRPQNDRLELVAAVALQEQNVVNFKNQYDLTKLNLKQLLKLDYKSEIDIELLTTYKLNADVETTTIDHLVEKVIENYPALKAAAINNDIAGMQINIAKSNLYPSITAGVSLGSNYSNQGKKIVSSSIILNEQPVLINGTDALLGIYRQDVQLENKPYFNQINDNISYGFGINLNIPIYNNYQSKASIEKAKLSLLRSQNNYEIIKNQLILSLQQVLADAKASKKEMIASEKSLIALENSYNNAIKKNEAGVISTFEFIQIKNQRDSAKLKNTIAKYNYIFKVKLLDYYLGIQ